MKSALSRLWALVKRWGLAVTAALFALSPVLDALSGIDLRAVLAGIIGETWAGIVAAAVLVLAALARSPLPALQKDPA